MHAARPELDPAAAVAYCREARRLRHRLRHSPVRMHREISGLRPAAPAPLPETPHDRFAAMVVAAVERSTLRYSRRLALIREAERMGIERFEANLIIAVVQHRLGKLELESPQPARRFSPGPWLAFGAVQIAILLAALQLWRLM